MTMNTTTIRRGGTAIGLATALAVPLVALGPAALAKGTDPVVKSGACTGSATWKLKAKHDNGRIEIEFQVDSNRAGQKWRVRLSDNGTRIFRDVRTTQPPSGSFTVHKLTRNRTGPDVIRARAVHGEQVCRGSVTV